MTIKKTKPKTTAKPAAADYKSVAIRGGAFIDPTDRVAVEDTHGNTIWIRPRMDFGTERRVSVLFGELDARRVNAMAYEHALLMCNILDWDGPLFEVDDPASNGSKKRRKMPYSDVMLFRLDPRNPQVKALITATMERIDELNADPHPTTEGEGDPTLATSTN